MKAVLLRGVLLLVLLATVASRIYGAPDGPADERAVIIKVLERQGLVALEQQLPFHRPWLFFSIPGCAGTMQVVAISINLQEVQQVEVALRPVDNHRYVYFGRVWPAAGVLDVRMEWLRQMARALIAARRSAMMKTLLMVVAPAGCRSMDAIDWRPIWDEA